MIIHDRTGGRWINASVAAAVVYYLLPAGPLPPLAVIFIKGAGVACLAGYALKHRAMPEARILAVIMALGAVGDMLIEIDRNLGALLFLLGHILAICLYMSHRRPVLTYSQSFAAGALLVLVPLIAYFMPSNRAEAWQTALYALALSAMAAIAWTSSFPRYLVGMGAVLFVASDMLIFARMGPLAQSVLPGVLIWPLYYAGQVMICVGVVGGLQKAGKNVITYV